MKNKVDIEKDSAKGKGKNHRDEKRSPLSPDITDIPTPGKKSLGSSSAPGEGPNPTPVEGDAR